MRRDIRNDFFALTITASDFSLLPCEAGYGAMYNIEISLFQETTGDV
jgi:hypothetical protein